jgi:hypothetical protein
MRICLSSLAVNNEGNKPYILTLLTKELTCPIISQRGRTLTINKFTRPSQMLRAKSFGNFNRLLTLEALNNVAINATKTIWQIETAPNLQLYTTLKTGDSCLYKFSGQGFYNLRTIVEGGCITTLNHILQVENFSVKDSILQQVLCRNTAEGKVQALVNGAVGPLRFKLNNGPIQNSPIFEGLAAGQYQLLAEDSIGQKDSIIFNITQPQTVIELDSVISQNPVCHAGNNGSIQLFARGGTPPFRFGLNQNNLQVNSFFENLSGGVYLVKAQDNNNCIAIDTVKLSPPNPIQIQFTTQADSCTNPASGKISCNITGGTMPYYLNWINYKQSGQTELDKLTQGYYYLRVTDQKACVKTDTAFVPLSNYVFTEEICAVDFQYGLSPNNTNYGMEITWNRSPNKRIASYQIWAAANDTAPFLLKKTIQASALGKFRDSIDFFTLGKRKYKLKSVDSCGRTSAFSKVAEPLALTAGYEPNFGFFPLLTWVKPNFNSLVLEYEIYRRKPGTVFSLIKTLDSNEFSLIDSSIWGQGFTFEYYISAKLMNNCQVSYIQSEIKPWATIGVGERLNPASGFSLYPNPAKQYVTIENSGNETFNTINLYGLQGKLIETYVLDHASKSYTLSLPQLAKGMYYLGLSNNQTKLINLPFWME